MLDGNFWETVKWWQSGDLLALSLQTLVFFLFVLFFNTAVMGGSCLSRGCVYYSLYLIVSQAPE